MSKVLSPDTRWSRLCGLYRLWWNQCPRCNSDAPAVDACVVCRNVQVRGVSEPNRRQQYPPLPETKALWWYCWLHPCMPDLQRDADQRRSRATAAQTGARA